MAISYKRKDFDGFGVSKHFFPDCGEYCVILLMLFPVVAFNIFK